MSKTKISWTDETANWIVGCTKVSAGCAHCYASTAANSARLQQFDQYKKVVDGKGNWNGNIEFVPKVLDDLLKGNRSRRVFAPSMSDPFHPNVKDEWLDQFMATVALTPHITYQCLTKRADRMLEYFRETWQGTLEQEFMGVHVPAGSPTGRREEVHLACEEIIDRHNLADTDKDNLWTENNSLKIMQWDWPLTNLHLGVTVENQTEADERIPLLLQTPAAVRFLSVEPLLEEVDLTRIPWIEGLYIDPLNGFFGNLGQWKNKSGAKIDQVIIGGESGSNARPFKLEWAKLLIEQCKESDTKVFMKQTAAMLFIKGSNSRPNLAQAPTRWNGRNGHEFRSLFDEYILHRRSRYRKLFLSRTIRRYLNCVSIRVYGFPPLGDRSIFLRYP